MTSIHPSASETDWGTYDYTPASMSSAHWAICAEEVRRAVTAAAPRTKADAQHLFAALTAFLRATPHWNGVIAPDWTKLLTAGSIHACASSQSNGNSARAHSGSLRRVARALGVLPPVGDRDRSPKKVDPLLEKLAAYGVPFASWPAIWREAHGSSMPSERHRGVIEAIADALDATEPDREASTFAAMSPSVLHGLAAITSPDSEL